MPAGACISSENIFTKCYTRYTNSMNKKIGFGMAAFIALIAIGFAILFNRPDTSKPTTTSQLSSSPAPVNEPATTPITNRVAYADYDEATFQKTEGVRVLFFHAPWCFQCRELDAGLKQNLADIPANVSVFKVDFDSNQALRQKYGVTFRTAFIKVDQDDKVLQNFIAYEEPTYANIRKNVLN